MKQLVINLYDETIGTYDDHPHHYNIEPQDVIYDNGKAYYVTNVMTIDDQKIVDVIDNHKERQIYTSNSIVWLLNEVDLADYMEGEDESEY